MSASHSRLPRKPSFSGDRPVRYRSTRWRMVIYVLVAVALFTFWPFSKNKNPHRVTNLQLFHHTPTHKPPLQKNSTSGNIHWFSDWKWLNPFSASITFDDERSVLPPLKDRPPIYTFYDADAEKDEKIKIEENKLLLIWRRAWWAEGLRPVVLGSSEATNNPLYESFQGRKTTEQFQVDLLRWLAWGQMGSGTLANWLCLPMGSRDDHLFSYLRRGKYPDLTRYDGLDDGLFTGEAEQITAAIKEALDSPKLEEAKSLAEIVKIKVDKPPSSVALYKAHTISELYKPISTKIEGNKAQGLAALAEIMIFHLHSTFLDQFPDGFAILTPYASKSHLLSHVAYSIANALRNCPATSLPSSCPPNRPKCKPCSPASAPPITTPEFFTNSSSTYLIGTTPHPYLFASLLSRTKDITTRHIRRDTGRDRWLSAVTQEALGKDMGGPSRLVEFKNSVAGEKGAARALWVLDHPTLSRKDIDYHFGFPLPTFNVTENDLPPSPNKVTEQEPSKQKQKAMAKDVQLQKSLIEAAKPIVEKERKKKEKTGVKEMVEAWNLADTEAWHFVRAFRARESVVRNRWDQEERKFAGGEEGDQGWRWFDRRVTSGTS